MAGRITEARRRARQSLDQRRARAGGDYHLSCLLRMVAPSVAAPTRAQEPLAVSAYSAGGAGALARRRPERPEREGVDRRLRVVARASAGVRRDASPIAGRRKVSGAGLPTDRQGAGREAQ